MSDTLAGRITDASDDSPLLTSLCIFTLIVSILLGGGTRNGYFSDTLLQFASIPLLIAVLWNIITTQHKILTGLSMGLCVAIPLTPLIQLLPLPPIVWSSLPGREPIEAILSQLFPTLPWMPLTVTPETTWLSVLSLIPPLGIFLGIALLNRRKRRLISLILIGVGLISVFIGLLQVAQGASSSLHFFESAGNNAVGFFANRNHFAALLYSLVLFCGAWTVGTLVTSGPIQFGGRNAFKTMGPIAAGITIIVILIAAQIVVQSRMGVTLTIIALIGIVAFGATHKSVLSSLSLVKIIGAAVSLALFFSAQFALYRFIQRLAVDPLKDARLDFSQNTLEAIWSFFPFGSGIGSFVSVYGMFEKTEHLLPNRFVNHAHNEILQLLLETGLLGFILMLVFVFWLARHILIVWRRDRGIRNETDRLLMQAATLVILLLIIHSLVDYPLRSGAMMAIFAFACALLIKPPMGVDDPGERTRQNAEYSLMESNKEPISQSVPLSHPAYEQPEPAQKQMVSTSKKPSGPSPFERWDEEIEWPEEWLKPKE